MDFLNAARKNAEGGSPVQQRASPKPGARGPRHSPALEGGQSPSLNGEGEPAAISPFVRLEVLIPETQNNKEEDTVAEVDEEEESTESPAAAAVGGDKFTPAGVIAGVRFLFYLKYQHDQLEKWGERIKLFSKRVWLGQ